MSSAFLEGCHGGGTIDDPISSVEIFGRGGDRLQDLPVKAGGQRFEMGGDDVRDTRRKARKGRDAAARDDRRSSDQGPQSDASARDVHRHPEAAGMAPGLPSTKPLVQAAGSGGPGHGIQTKRRPNALSSALQNLKHSEYVRSIDEYNRTKADANYKKYLPADDARIAIATEPKLVTITVMVWFESLDIRTASPAFGPLPEIVTADQMARQKDTYTNTQTTIVTDFEFEKSPIMRRYRWKEFEAQSQSATGQTKHRSNFGNSIVLTFGTGDGRRTLKYLPKSANDDSLSGMHTTGCKSLGEAQQVCENLLEQFATKIGRPVPRVTSVQGMMAMSNFKILCYEGVRVNKAGLVRALNSIVGWRAVFDVNQYDGVKANFTFSDSDEFTINVFATGHCTIWVKPVEPIWERVLRAHRRTAHDILKFLGATEDVIGLYSDVESGVQASASDDDAFDEEMKEVMDHIIADDSEEFYGLPNPTPMPF
jgi:hypothetical protein